MRAWRSAFEVDGLTDWGTVKPGRGRKPTITEEQVAEICWFLTGPCSCEAKALNPGADLLFNAIAKVL